MQKTGCPRCTVIRAISYYKKNVSDLPTFSFTAIELY